MGEKKAGDARVRRETDEKGTERGRQRTLKKEEAEGPKKLGSFADASAGARRSPGEARLAAQHFLGIKKS